MVLYFNKCRETLVLPAKYAVRLPELKKYGEGGQNAGKKSGSGGYLLEKAGSHCPNARRPWGGTTARRETEVVEVPGATLEARCPLAPCGQRRGKSKCGLPPYSRVVPVDASPPMLYSNATEKY